MLVLGTHRLSQLPHPHTVLKSPYPSALTLLICSITLNATAREYLPQGTLRGSGKHCSPETTLGPQPRTASWTLTRASISGKDLPGEEGTDMKEKEEKEEEKKKKEAGRRKRRKKEATKVTDLKHSPPSLLCPMPASFRAQKVLRALYYASACTY